MGVPVSRLGFWVALSRSCCSVAGIRELCQTKLELFAAAAAAVGLSFCSTRQSDKQTDATAPRDEVEVVSIVFGPHSSQGASAEIAIHDSHFVGW
jgi:hypothetical protein